MLSPTELYPIALTWLQALGITTHPTALAALAHLLTALLVGQSLGPAIMARTLLSPTPLPARQRYKRRQRAWTRRWLTSAWLTPRLVRATLALVAPDPAGWPTAGLTHVALDSVRCWRWEVFTLGVVWHGRVLPVAWAVLPYPLPKGRFGPTVQALVRRVAAAWPAARPVHLVADRAFPSGPLFRTLQALDWGWTVRVRATDGVRVDGEPGVVRDRLRAATPGRWNAWPATFGTGPRAGAGTLVVGRGLVVLPAHQCGPASLRQRGRQQARRQQHLATKKPGGAGAGLRASDPWVALFTTHPTVRAATASYRRRWATEGTYRDAQRGWDGQHGWDLEPVLRRRRDPGQVERVVGLWALGTLVQSWVGHQVGAATAPAAVQAVVGQWTTTGRLSVWARGRFALTEPSGALRAWLAATLTAGAQRLAAAPPPVQRVLPLPERPPAPRRRAAPRPGRPVACPRSRPATTPQVVPAGAPPGRRGSRPMALV